MKKNYKFSVPFLQLLALIRLALTGQTSKVLDAYPIDWALLLAEAKKQTVVGIVFAALDHLPADRLPDMKTRLMWHNEAMLIHEQNKRVNRRCQEVAQMFAKQGLRTSIMKGQGNASRYITPTGDLRWLRTSGDIDIWVEGGFERVNEATQRILPTCEIDEFEIKVHNPDEITIEVHYKPYFMRSPRKNRLLLDYLYSEADPCYANLTSLEAPDGSTVQAPMTTLRFNLIHQLCHIQHHLLTEGIGLRQLIDYYFLLINADQPLRDETWQMIRRLGLERFTHALMWVLKTIMLGAKADQCPDWLLCQPEEEDGRFLLNEIMTSGNFGHQDARQSLKQLPLVGGLWTIFIRNLSLYRFSPGEWFWGPAWRIYHRIWKLTKGYK